MKKISIEILVNIAFIIVYSVFNLFIFPIESKSQNLLIQPESVVFDSLNNRYFVSNAGNGNIIQIDSVGNQSYFAGYSASIRGIYIVGNTLYTAGNGGVVGFNINTADTTFILTVTGAGFLNDITSDGMGFLYITDSNTGRIYKVNISSQTYTTFVSLGITSPNGLLYDGENNRLILCSFRSNSPIQAINLSNSSVSTIVTTNLSNLDGLAEDAEGNIYVSSWGTTSVYRFDSSFTSPPELISSGHSGPADITFNKQNHILAVPNFNSNTVDFILVPPISVGGYGQILPKDINLKQNYPNPFNPATKIGFQISDLAFVSLKVFDVSGSEITTLVNEKLPAGVYEVEFGSNFIYHISSGIYFYKLSVDNKSQVRKMVLIR